MSHLSETHSLLDPLDTQFDTLPKFFVALAERYGAGKVAMRKKRYGLWQEYSWADSLAHVRDFCLGLTCLGLQRGDKVSIIGENDPEYYWAELALQSAGGTAIGVFTDATPHEIEHLVTDSDSTFVIAHDQEQCDKMLELRSSGKIPAIKNVIYWEGRGLWSYDDPWLLSFEEVEEKGRAYAAEHPTAFQNMVAAGHGEDAAIFSYTSGTTSLPKGAVIAHSNLLYGTRHVVMIAPFYDTDDYVSFSPLAWITEQSLGLSNHVQNGIIINFPERPETVQNDIREIAPATLLFPSRLWESLISMVHARLNDSTWINRALYRLFMPVGYKMADYEDSGQTVPVLWRFLNVLGDIAIFQPLRDKLGMVNMREAYTSGSALSPDVLRWFRAIGVTLKNLYGSTECQTHTVHRTGEVRLDTVGQPPPGVEIKVGDNNEILVRSRSVFRGYYKAPEQTAVALDSEGWFHTGDAGYIREDGHLVFLDRVTDLISLSSGETFSPQYIEGRLKFSAYINNAMAIGSWDTPFVSAIINIEFDNVARWAEQNRVSFTTFVDLSQKPEIYALVKIDVEHVNATLPPAARIKRFVILHKTFDPDEAELTRTRKLRRHFMEQRYGAILSAIYEDKDSVPVRAEVKYRDGRTGVVETMIRIMTLDTT